MASESRLPVVIFAAIVAIITVPFVVDWVRERRRPVLVEARIVTATSSDPVYRSGRRDVPPGHQVEIALALRLERWGRDDQWISPAADLEIDGASTPHLQTIVWPDDDRVLRVFWFSVESTILGGSLTEENAGDRLRYRTFLAPEMGRAMHAERLPELHNDDYIGQNAGQSAEEMGTYRVYARVEVVEEADDIAPLQTATTLEVERMLESTFPSIVKGGDLGENIDPAAGELFRLPGFEPEAEPPEAWNTVTEAAFQRTFTQLVSDRVVVSSWTLAATAAGGHPDVDPVLLEDLGQITIADEIVRRNRRPLEWGSGVIAGDLLSEGNHWMVLLGDNGNGVLDTSDAVLHSWGRPAERTTLFAAIDSDTDHLEFRRMVR